MKKSLKIILTITLLFSFVTIGFAQKPEHAGKKEKIEKEIKKEKKKVTEDAEEVLEEKKQKKEKVEKKIKKEKKEKIEEIEEQGNSYGKDKYGLEGKAYGQERARQAKLKKEEKVKELEGALERGESKANNARARVKEVKENLKTQKKEGKITKEAYDEKMEKLKAIENEADSLEKKVEKGKKLEKSEVN